MLNGGLDVGRLLLLWRGATQRSGLRIPAGRMVDDRIGPIVHLMSTWNIDKARDLAWVTVETLWALRHTRFLRPRFLSGLGHTVGMTSRALLTPAPAGLDLWDFDLLT